MLRISLVGSSTNKWNSGLPASRQSFRTTFCLPSSGQAGLSSRPPIPVLHRNAMGAAPASPCPGRRRPAHQGLSVLPPLCKSQHWDIGGPPGRPGRFQTHSASETPPIRAAGSTTAISPLRGADLASSRGNLPSAGPGFLPWPGAASRHGARSPQRAPSRNWEEEWK